MNFSHGSYNLAEGETQQVTVTLNADPERDLVIPITKTGMGGAMDDDYSGVPENVTFNNGETSKFFTFTAFDDDVDDDDERVRLGFGTMPDERVSTGTTSEVVLDIIDDDLPHVNVQFGQDSYLLAEGETVNVTISLSADPGAHGDHSHHGNGAGRRRFLRLLRAEQRDLQRGGAGEDRSLHGGG